MMGGATRGRGGRGLGQHLADLRPAASRHNESVRLGASRGLMADGIVGQIDELTVLVSHARTKQPLYHVHADPPADVTWSEAQWTHLWELHEREFGLEAQEFSESIHASPDGREHRHRVYSRIRGNGTAIRLDHDFARREKINRIVEFDSGEPLQTGAHNRAVIAALIRDGRQDVADAMLAEGKADAPKPVAVSPRERARGQRTGVDPRVPDQQVLFAWCTSHRGPEALVAHVLARTSSTIALDPAAYRNNPNLEARLRRLVSHASMFQRDTSIDGRYMGFPFPMVGDGRRGTGSARPRIAPVLLWPVAFEFSNDAAGRAARLAFRAEGEEVRLNPALESIVGGGAVERWRRAKDDLLARDSLRVADVMDVLAHLAAPQGRTLARIPGRDAANASAEPELVAAAALFHAEFTGQAVAEDIRLLRGKPIAGTSLEAALRIVEPGEPGPVPATSEGDRYNTVESDPSQDDAVLRSRSGPGLLVEGPPGTGKSQTIVNMVANAVGHGETVLVVCQKLAALKVVEKRLKAEGLGDRLFLLADVNRDRTSVVNALRTQVPAARTADPGRVADLGRRRQALAARIEVLEGEIDRHHAALYSRDQPSGLSYRDVVGQLIEVEASGLTIDGRQPGFERDVLSFDGQAQATTASNSGLPRTRPECRCAWSVLTSQALPETQGGMLTRKLFGAPISIV